MNEILFLVEEAPEGGYTARAMDAEIFTQADTLPELKEAIKDSIHCHFDPDMVPDLVHLHIIKDETFSIV
jgi:hypothetical protein